MLTDATRMKAPSVTITSVKEEDGVAELERVRCVVGWRTSRILVRQALWDEAKFLVWHVCTIRAKWIP